MKIVIKNLKQITYDVEIVDDHATVRQLKNVIESQHGFGSDTLKLLYNGVVLDDVKTLASYHIKEENIIIMIITKGKPINNKPNSVIENNKEKKEENVSSTGTVKIPKTKEDVKVAKVAEKDYTTEIKTLKEIGFGKEESENAIKAAKGSVSIAIEFLYNGIPNQDIDIEENAQMQLQDNDGNNEGDNDIDDEDNDDDNIDGDDNADDVDMDGDDEDTPEISSLRKTASIVKVLYSQNPSNLEGILLNVQQSSPELLDLINENKEEFEKILKEPVTEEDMKNYLEFQNDTNQQLGHEHEGEAEEGDGGEENNSLQLTQEEFEVIKRLKEMGGFSDEETTQAYFACDKNEEMAANFLFENKFNNTGYQGKIINIYHHSIDQINTQLQNFFHNSNANPNPNPNQSQQDEDKKEHKK